MTRNLTDPRESISNLLAFNSRDWAQDRADAWLWGIVHGWDVDEDETDPEAESAMDELASRHGWGHVEVARLRQLHENWKRLTLEGDA